MKPTKHVFTPFARRGLVRAGLCVLFLCCAQAATGKVSRININTANVKELMALPYIGQKRAEAIVKSRKEVGKYRQIEELISRKIIGKDTFEAIQYRISVLSLKGESAAQPIEITNIHINGLSGNIFFLDNQNFARVLTAKVQEARESIHVAMYLFKTSKNKANYANQLSQKLINARKRGVEVEVILEYSDYNFTLNESNASTMKRLKDHGIKVRFDSPETQTHTKLIIIDNQFTFIGSHNFSHSALARNNEVSLMVDSQEIAKKSLGYFQTIQ